MSETKKKLIQNLSTMILDHKPLQEFVQEQLKSNFDLDPPKEFESDADEMRYYALTTHVISNLLNELIANLDSSFD